MKIAIVNGSARKGNTLAAIEVFSEGAKTKNEILLMEKKHDCIKHREKSE